MNLQPNQVYNWFANYRRRQKTRLSRLEKLINSTDEESSTHQAKHQPDSGSCIPQAAGWSPPSGLGIWKPVLGSPHDKQRGHY